MDCIITCLVIQVSAQHSSFCFIHRIVHSHHDLLSLLTGTFACKAHVNCEHKTRLWTISNGDWWVQTCGLHKVVAATGGSSLTPFVKNKITELSKVGAKPRAIQALLSKSLPQEMVPGLTQIHNIKARISAEVVPVTSHADLLVRLAELSVERMSNPEDQSTWPSPSTVIVVSIWNSGLLPPSMAVVPGACAQGFAIMSTAMLSKPGVPAARGRSWHRTGAHSACGRNVQESLSGHVTLVVAASILT
jgi:hypothetical protein